MDDVASAMTCPYLLCLLAPHLRVESPGGVGGRGPLLRLYPRLQSRHVRLLPLLLL
jgi:hypothetical protein